MIYFFILGFILLVAYILFFLYWPSRQYDKIFQNGHSVYSFPPEFGVLFFTLSIISFIIGFLILKKKKDNNELALFTSLSLIFVWAVMFLSQFLKNVILIFRPDLNNSKNPLIGFIIPEYTINLNIAGFIIKIPNVPYLHVLLLVGIFGVILFYTSFASMIEKIKEIAKQVNLYYEKEYKIATVLSIVLFIGFIILFYFVSVSIIYLDLIVLLLSTSISGSVIFTILMVLMIDSEFMNLDKAKLNIRKNSIALGILLNVVFAITIDLLFLMFFSNIPVGESFYWRIRDIISNSLYIGMIYLEISLGITLVFKILKFANFAHAELVTFGAYMAFVFGAIGDSIGTWTIFSGLGFFQWIPVFVILGFVSFIMTAILAYLMDLVLFKPLRNRDASPITLMIASFAMGLSFRMVMEQMFTNKLIVVSAYLVNINLDSIILRITIIAFVFFSVWFFQILLYKTKYGKIMRAVSDNEDLAKVTGIKTSRIHLLVWIIAGGFAGVAGLLYSSYPVGVPWIKPDMGFALLLSAFAVTVLGGIGSFEGVVLASLIIGFTENMGVIVLNQLSSLHIKFDIPIYGSFSNHTFTIPFINYTIVLPATIIIPTLTNLVANLSFDSGYKIALSYVILIIVLKIRPYGLLGEKPSGDR